MEYLKLGKIIDSFSLDGTLKVLSSTNLKGIRYQKGNIIYIKDNNHYTPLTVEHFRTNGDIDFIKVKEINNKDEAIAKKNFEIYIEKENSKLPKDSYFFFDLEQCFVYDDKNNKLGKVIKVEEFPAQITLRVMKNNEKDYFFVPFIPEFINKVNIDKKEIIINVIKGLL